MCAMLKWQIRWNMCVWIMSIAGFVTTGVKYWYLCPELESFQRASSLQGPPPPPRYMLEYIRGGVGESLMKVF